MKEFAIALNQNEKKPLYEQIYEAIKTAILEGRIPRGEKLPSTRFEAEYLCCSRSTVELAYSQLLAEGYIDSLPYRGYYVSDVRELYQTPAQVENTDRASENADPEEEADAFEIDFSPNRTDLSSFPCAEMGRLMRNVFMDSGMELLRTSNPKGEWNLRRAIREYVFQSRNVKCVPEQIIIGAGNQYLQILLGQVLGKDCRVAMESPTYKQAFDTFCNIGYPIDIIPSDQEGMQVSLLEKSSANLAYVMPSHQFPSGMIMPMKRRLELLHWAQEAADRYIVEDDYDSEFRYRGKPIPSLQGMDTYGKVIYLGTFSRSVVPSIRISYMILPVSLLPAFEKTCGVYACTVPAVMQEMMVQFMRQGFFEKNLNRMRGIYKAKHDDMLAELKKCPWVKSIRGEHAGLHLVVEIKSEKSEQEIVEACRKYGIRACSMSEYDVSEKKAGGYPTFLFGYGGLTREQIQKGIQIFSKLI